MPSLEACNAYFILFFLKKDSMRAKCYLKEKFFFQPGRIRFHTINFIISK